MNTKLANIRQEYTKGGLREASLPEDPLTLLANGYKRPSMPGWMNPPPYW